ncbi:unnamed protein product [Phytomonas sp. Hart1]|nr:unnamed protein product [Phytomonas sp. Hart1]|eukprot:CCW66914.1 unnamed protein product [Phytomonas sp. isolate Hart1]
MSLNSHDPDIEYQDEKCVFQIESDTIDNFLRPYFANEDRVSKVKCCRAYYTVILLYSGTLILFSPLVPVLHGKVLSDKADPVVDVAAGDYHIVFCTKSGSVYSCGYSNRYGQLGDGSVWDTLPNLQDSSELDKSCRSCSMPPLLSSPRYVLGFYNPISPAKALAEIHSKEGLELMKGSENDKCSASSGVDPILFTTDPSAVCICEVSCGAEHTLLLSAALNGVYSCGRGHCGQLGHRQCAIPLQPVFRLIPLSFGLPIRQILGAGHHSFFLTRTGRLFGFGENQAGQLGIGLTSNVFTPTPVKFLSLSNSEELVSEGGKINATEEGVPFMNKSPSKGKTPLLLDSRAYTTLHAPYASVESIYYPLRTKRLEVELEPDNPFIEAIWGCSTITIVLTKQLDWLSCGLPISRSWAHQDRGKGANSRSDPHGLYAPRHDGYGALGRPILRVEDAWLFGRMSWSVAIRWAMHTLIGMNAENATTPASEPVVASVKREGLLISYPGSDINIECLSYPHLSLVRLRQRQVDLNRPDAESKHTLKKMDSLIFIESSVCDATFERIIPMNFKQNESTIFNSTMSINHSNYVAQPLLMTTHSFLKKKKKV